jgi:predicted GIY-YIG superfamily endonuclease
MPVYLLHFDRPYRHAKHYLGTAADLEQRLRQHGTASGARLMEVVAEHGIGWRLARTWDGGRELERKLKSHKHGPRLCPLCNRRAAA